MQEWNMRKPNERSPRINEHGHIHSPTPYDETEPYFEKQANTPHFQTHNVRGDIAKLKISF